jgi:hypothetical protein
MLFGLPENARITIPTHNIVRYREKLEIVILDDHSKVFLLSKKFEKWYTATPLFHSFQ